MSSLVTKNELTNIHKDRIIGNINALDFKILNNSLLKYFIDIIKTPICVVFKLNKVIGIFSLSPPYI